MNVAPLPLELVSLILTELRLSCGDDDAARRSNGLATALVCKAWQPLGVCVVWHSVRLDSPSRTRRLSERAEQFPHFPAFIKKAWFRWVNYEAITRVLPLLKHYRTFKLGAAQHGLPYPLSILPKLAALPHLNCLSLLTALSNDGWETPAHTFAPIRITRISLVVVVAPQAAGADTSHFYLDLFDDLDTHTLRDMTLMLHPGDLAVIHRLFCFPSLRILIVVLPASPAAFPLVDRMLQAASPHPIPLTVVLSGAINTAAAERGATELRLPSTGSSSLTAFLDAVPTSIVDFRIDDFYLNANFGASRVLIHHHANAKEDLDSDPVRRLSTIERIAQGKPSGVCRVPVRCQGSEEGELADCMCARSVGSQGETTWIGVQ
ncbi:hypothetical protein JCM10207_006410 [Rhodosporidiobolus poonsookiae]